jgi:soluble lytic murein transglycosylase
MRTLFRALLLATLLASCEAAPPQATPAPASLAPTSPPTQQPAPLPASEQLADGLQLRDAGAYEQAARVFHALGADHPDSPQAPAARYYLAESYVQRGLWASAVAALAPIAQATPTDPDGPFAARALFLLARAQAESGDHEQAAATLDRYIALRTPIVGYAQLQRADQLVAAGRPAEAAAVYQAAAESDMLRGERALAHERAAEAYLRAEQPSEALRIYAALLELAEQPAYRARVLLAAAEVAGLVGEADQARQWRLMLLGEAPYAPEAIAALDQLIAEGIAPPGAALAAQVYVGAERWPEARAQLELAAAGSGGLERIDLLRRAALTLRNGDAPDYPGALAALGALLAEADPQSEVARQLRLDQIQTVGQSGDLQAAIDGYQRYAADLPDDPRAPEALERAAILLERRGDAAAAVALRLDLIQRFPDSTEASELRFVAGMAQYRAGALREAAALWEQQAQRESGVAAAQGAFWAASAHEALGETAASEELLARAQALAPSSYYGVRAAEIEHQPPSGSVPLGAPFSPADWEQLLAWVESWATAPDPPAATYDAVLRTPQVQRATALAEVLLPAKSHSEWRDALGAWGDDPHRIALLAQAAHERQQTTIAMEAAAQLASLAPIEAGQPPPALGRLRYPTPHAQIVIAAAQEQQLDPLALYALVRQESSFSPGAVSAAGARGLAQIMPDTGSGIAQRLGVTPFDERDLHQPQLGLRFGAFYLANQLRSNDGNLYVALAGYNGGPANAERWAADLGLDDQDLFVELIDFGETRAYVKLVYANYRSYQQIYRAP